jgi:hypothetical protein
MNLLEKYKNRMSVAESVYRKANGTGMDMNRKLVIAKALENTEKFLNEAFDNSTGTQRSDMGMYKKFALNLVNVALPQLIAPELVIVHAMDSMSGYVTYLNYTAGSNKGATKKGDVFNSVFGLGAVDKDYTSARVVETVALEAGSGDFSGMKVGKLAWKPLMAVHEIVGGTRDDDIEWYWGRKAILTATRDPEYVAEDGDTTGWNAAAKSFQNTIETEAFKVLSASGLEDWTDITVVNANTGMIALTTDADSVKVAYIYDNQVIPQQDLPLLNAAMEAIPLVAKARRIAIYYSQIAAFQAKQDYGFDLGDQLAEKAVGQLRYEIDTEICDGLIGAAAADSRLTWSKVLPIGLSKAEHYEGFSEIIEIGKQIIYDRTKRFVPNYLLIASNILPMLGFMKGFQAAPVSSVNGPYMAGTLNGLKVFVTPNIAPGKFVLGVNGDDMMTSAAVYAVYMPVVPTQLLQYADGGTSQGFSTLYDFKILNANLLVAGQVLETPNLTNIGA